MVIPESIMKMKTIFELLLKNTLTQISVLGFIMIVSGILANFIDWFYDVMVVSACLLTVIAVAYILGGIFGLIKEYFKKK